MVDKISRLQVVRHSKLNKKNDTAKSQVSNSTAVSNNNVNATTKADQASTTAQTLRKQFIMQQLIKQFGEHMVHEPKFQDMYKFFERKLASSPELQVYVDKNMRSTKPE